MDPIEIKNNIKVACDSSSYIKRCMDDNKFLCDELNNLDKNYIRSIYKSEKSGVVIDLRKEVAKTILLDEINEELILEIIESHKLKNPGKILMNNPYRILNPLINITKSDSVEFVNKFGEIIKERIGDCKMHIWDFSGARFQGQDWCCALFYNKDLKSQSDGMQIWISFKPNIVEYGVTDYLNGEKEIILTEISPDEFDLDLFYKFIDDNKNIILDQKIEPGMTFHGAAKLILEEFGNKPMSANEIWSEIEKRRLVKTGGKTPAASLTTIILNDSVDSPVKSSNSKNIFKIVSNSPNKYILNNFMPKHIKENLTKNGFITIDMLKDIFEKNGLKLEL